ncbi:hypothetical protein K3G63_06615 [Hymenobacter sp. HSC-4F20]|uniref:hypothetical protein n=1 Tax=Hymenobacter sp. HSC-4F20 TaxID=2864135 RepID=UPI001C73A8E1|nr:hypothetical protein [Hymenobacter sp. HSC-4F20]MBX0290103.1 hypothetical protein [Hymenobacter sp. HSC-4F20]
MFTLFLQAPITQELQHHVFDWWKILTPVIATVVGGVVMLVINHYRESSKQYDNRIKTLESQGINHENRFTKFQLEREHLVDKFESRLQSSESKLSKVDRLSDDVNRLTNDVVRLSNDILNYGKTIEKMDAKFDEIIKEIWSKK